MNDELIRLSHELGREDRGLAILGEGNTSQRESETTFRVKASGSCLGTLDAGGLTECAFDRLLPLFERELKDDEVDAALLAARVDENAKKPSVEALFHAYLLTLEGVEYVGHTHPIAVNGLLCSPHARAFAHERCFPDQVVCCGDSSVLVPYTDPGLALARAIRAGTEEFMAATGSVPRVILLEKHGLIALGRTPDAVLAATFMAEKSARVFAAAASIGGPTFLTPGDVTRISGRSDEHYRQKMLNM